MKPTTNSIQIPSTQNRCPIILKKSEFENYILDFEPSVLQSSYLRAIDTSWT